MLTRLISMLTIVALLLVQGCMSWHLGGAEWFAEKWPLLSQQAAFDLECSADQLKTQQLDKYFLVVGVEGCSRRVVYMYVAEREAWVRNGEVRGTETKCNAP